MGVGAVMAGVEGRRRAVDPGRRVGVACGRTSVRGMRGGRGAGGPSRWGSGAGARSRRGAGVVEVGRVGEVACGRGAASASASAAVDLGQWGGGRRGAGRALI